MNLHGKLNRLLIGALLSAFAMQAQSACTFFDGFKDNKNGTATDSRTGVIWKRCAEGFTWNGSTCSGSAKEFSWFEAMQGAKDSRFLNKNDWRLPTSAELEQVIGKNDECKRNDYKKGQYAASSVIAHPVKEDGHPGFFWSTSPNDGYTNHAWLIDIANGFIYDYVHRGQTNNARLVRFGQATSVDAGEFKREYSKVLQFKEEVAAKKVKEAQERREQADRDEQYRRDAPARQARQMCEAQKQSCLASCPSYNGNVGLGSSVNDHHFQCNSRCNQISC